MNAPNPGTILLLGFALIVLIAIVKGARVVPQRTQFVVERLGKYSRTLDAGFHVLVPFIDRIAYQHSLKEEALDVPKQSCITRDNIGVSIDGILYLQVVDAKGASYGITNYHFAVTQLAQTTLRSEIGKLELDKTFEAREAVNAAVVSAIDKASEAWGIKVLRYEIKDIEPPISIKETLEKQMTAERERRALVAKSEGERQAQINISEGVMREKVNYSEAEKIRQINEAEGKAREIELIAEATATGLRKVAETINGPGGAEAVRLRIAEQYIREFGHIAKEANTLVVPANLSDVASMIALASKAFDSAKSTQLPPKLA
jgi:regulator of protease activity HflC (stomatin/prohibitin superfamily)